MHSFRNFRKDAAQWRLERQTEELKGDNKHPTNM